MKISRHAYAEMFGPTTGDRVRLADSELLIEIEQDFTIYGFGGSTNNFNDRRYPGNTMDCAKCHTGTTFTLPLTAGIANVDTLRDYFPSQGPATASCLGCHDSVDTAAHAYLNTVTFPGSTTSSEACATCHGTGKDWAVEKVHAQ